MAAEPQKVTWEVAPQMDAWMAPVLERIDFLRQARLTSVMVVVDYLCRCLVPLPDRAQPCWVDDLSWAELPWKEMALCANPDRVALQAKLPKFDAQGLVDRPGRQNPGTIQIPGVDEAAGEEAASDLAETDGPGAAGGELQASGGAAAGSSRQARKGGAADSGAVIASGDRGKRPRIFVPAPASPPSSSPGEEGGRGGQSFSVGPSEGAASAPGDRTAAPHSPPLKKRREDSGPMPSGLGYRIPALRWPPAEVPRPAPAPEPSAPEPSMLAEPEPSSTPAETETQVPPSPERVAAAVPGPPAPAESAPSASSVGRSTSSWAVPTWQFSGTLSPSEEARRGPSAQPSPSQPPTLSQSCWEAPGR
ncbi:vegetative cell wall protein gp1-like [Phragmites australis]|uniref:vegetative cell wall protein gp1-like n=1 Tax=Phragmites australis TaxID=29695 RepID=UPI002D7989F1|nr:vegetative cell wall protein gp1-like [Phragmites australis]